MADEYIHSLTDIWNSGATTFYAIKMNVTDTASAADSKLIEQQVGGVAKWSVDKAGNLVLTGNATGVNGVFSGTMAVTGAASAAALTLTTDLAVAHGGTGASDQLGAQTNLDVPPNARTITAGTGLTGGGNLSADRTISIDAGGVGTTQLADNGGTNAKLANMAEATIKGRAAGAGTGDPQDLTPAQTRTILAIPTPNYVNDFRTASGTWTKPANLAFVVVEVWGGGGGGAGGSAGGASSFGSHLSATGGAGATASAYGGAGGIGSGGNWNLQGGSGGNIDSSGFGGTGGSAPLGSGGGTAGSSGSSTVGGTPGGGGGAGAGPNGCGGGGGYSRKKIAAADLGATETVTVGAAGAAGTGGSAGGAGRVNITEYYLS